MTLFAGLTWIFSSQSLMKRGVLKVRPTQAPPNTPRTGSNWMKLVVRESSGSLAYSGRIKKTSVKMLDLKEK
jgi:hypothetical protein